MLLRFASIGPIACLSLCTLLACSESQPANGSGGGGGSGSSSGGMPGAGTSPGASGSASGGSSSGASASAGSTSGGSATAGAAGSASGGSASGGSGGASAGGSGGSGSGGAASKTTFFVTSDKSMTGKLGGLTGADMRCQTLATAAGITGHTFKAYLSTSTVSAKDRIGAGPWYNSNGVLLAQNVTDLHNPALVKGNADLFIDENKQKINGQWNGGNPNEHDVLTGSKPDGTVQTGLTCQDWTSDSTADMAQVGHSDGMGPGMATTGTYSSWNSSHVNGNCADTAPKGGAGRLYCFAAD